ncbi:hypothetical protein [Ruminococcus sp.]|jgi:nitroreductase|uniref:hypothetical protein n=1 Tax=Ruminococcus sp. TaxID=41978 RepID=UPI002805760B|nr:hypothetical protein [Ruminococcus sp.]MEE0022311.1 hypothetical protein [Ruminococcus sp.]
MILHNATVDTILEAGRFAPSGMNQQSAIAVAVPLLMPAPVPTRGFPRRKKWSSC